MAIPNRGMSVPAFGEWDRKVPGTTNYSMLFSQARANRKQHKTNVWRSLGNEFDFTAFSLPQEDQDCVTNNANMFGPEPGGSGEKAVRATNNSMPSLRDRAVRNRQKTDASCSLGNEQDSVDASSPYQQDNNDDPVKRKRWTSVPEFGGWDRKAPGSTNYSMVFSEARANRKQQKSNVFRSLGNEQELVAAALAPHPRSHRQHNHQDSATSRSPLARASVPEFGYRKAPGSADYTMVSSQPRANRKRQKIYAWRSRGNEQDFDAASLPNVQPYRQDKLYSVSKRKKVLAYITCCIRPR